ncbi:MAG TPA: sugar phosphate isomerase/epimerase family protein [Bacillota bacterium]
MKLGLAIAPEKASPLSFVVFRDRLDVCMSKAKKLGFDGVELALLSADEVEVEALRRMLDQYELMLPVISTGRFFGEGRLYLTNPDQKQRRTAIDRFKEIIKLAASFGAMVNVGRVRGFIDEGGTREGTEKLFLQSFWEVTDFAGDLGVEIILEPVNRYEINFINSVTEGLELLEKIGRRNVKLMPDVFHMNIEDASIEGSLRAAGDKIGYIHLADSNRLAPGQGHLDFPKILQTLQDIGYDGFVTLEILPKPDPDTAARLGAEYMRSIMKEH